MREAKHIFIINPAAGKADRSALVAEEVARQAGLLGIDYEIHLTQHPGHASRLVSEAGAASGSRPLRFYACGGDGTLNEVARSAVGFKNAYVANYPIGSGNDFNKIFGVENLGRFTRLSDLIQGDPIRLDYIDTDCGVAVNILSVGIDAEIAGAMSKYKRVPGLAGHGSYIAATLERVLRGIRQEYRVEVDGQAFDGLFTLILAANGRYYGGGFHAVPDADPADGRMDVLLVEGISRLKIARIIGGYKQGRYRDFPDVIRAMRAKELKIGTKGNKLLTVNLDGEITRVKEITVRMVAGGLGYMVPSGLRVEKPALI